MKVLKLISCGLALKSRLLYVLPRRQSKNVIKTVKETTSGVVSLEVEEPRNFVNPKVNWSKSLYLLERERSDWVFIFICQRPMGLGLGLI